jgi:hypothetical protein
MAKVEAAFVRQELNWLNDIEVARIVALGPSEAEVVEARTWLEGDDSVVRELDEPMSAIVGQIVTIARKAAEAEEDD